MQAFKKNRTRFVSIVQLLKGQAADVKAKEKAADLRPGEKSAALDRNIRSDCLDFRRTGSAARIQAFFIFQNSPSIACFNASNKTSFGIARFVVV